ncbi:hypothetical protein H2248_012224 [Termitomyces sp. 'cryptogamus']|nr:hypothetical protein H2248_012224 [Termitomyces sp. 'cryptogamus']
MVDHTNLPATLGALLLGGLFSTILSGALSAQCTLYFNRFPEDKVWLKILAIIIWLNTRLDKPPKFSFPFRRFMDLVETCFIWAILWYYFIAHFGDRSAIDTTPWTVGLITLLSSIITGLVQEFYACRIFILSEHHWLLPLLITVLCLIRLGFGAGERRNPLDNDNRESTHHIYHTAVVSGFILFPTFTSFRHHTGWLMTTGLSLLAGTDLIVTFSLVRLLYSSRTSTSSPINSALTSLIQYTFKAGLINCAGALASLICWCVMPRNLVFLTLFWAIAKLYANSFFSVLNAREALRKRRSMEPSGPVFRAPSRFSINSRKIKVPPHTRAPIISKSMSFPQLRYPRDSGSSQQSSLSHGTSVSFDDRARLM